MNSFLYYSGIHYSSPNLYTGSITGLTNYDTLLTNYKMLLITEKSIFLSDNYDKVNERINISGNSEDTFYQLTQTNIGLKNLFQNDISHFYLKNKYLTTDKSYQFNITLPNYILSYKNDSEIPSVNNTLINIDNIKSTETNKKYDYLLIKNAITTTYTNNSTTNFKLTDVEDVFTLKTFDGTSLPTNYFTIHYKPNTGSNDNSFVHNVYEYLITTHHNLSTFIIEGFTSHSKYETIQINLNDSITNTTTK